LDRGELPVLLLMDWWARFAPEDAFTWARREGMASDPNVLTAVFEAWGAQDPEGALAALDALRNRTWRDAAVTGLVYGWGDADAAGALAWLRTLPQGFERQTAISHLVRRKLMREGVAPTLRWAEAMEDEPQ